MRRWTCLLSALALTACGGVATRDDSTTTTREDTTAPGVAVTAAPGVAFNYRYAFRLPAERIATAQERHAQACEQLGVARCRITGMRYTLVGGDKIDAMLAFKLDPALARAFGKKGIAAIEAAEGMLVNAEITGVDAGAAIARLQTDTGQITQEQDRIQRDLGRSGQTDEARAELLRQRNALQDHIRTTANAAADQRESLASTPVTFDYQSGTAIRRFDPRSPFAEAADTAIASLQWTLALTLGAVALLGPPALLGTLLLFAWFGLRRRFPKLVRRDAE